MLKKDGTNPTQTYNVVSGAVVSAGQFAVLSNGNVTSCAGTSGTAVVGIIDMACGGVATIMDGVMCFANDTGDGKITRADRGTVCYAKDATTVTKTATNGVKAGLVVDVDDDGVWVDSNLATRL